MGFKAKGPTTGAELALLVQGNEIRADYPAPQPPEAKATDDIRSLVSMSDKELRIVYAGLYQAVIQSMAVYTAHCVMSVDEWHQVVDREVDYFMRRVLEKARKE